MENMGYCSSYAEEPDFRSKEFCPFLINFQKSILLSLLAHRKLTQAQYERCMEKVYNRYRDNPPA